MLTLIQALLFFNYFLNVNTLRIFPKNELEVTGLSSVKILKFLKSSRCLW